MLDPSDPRASLSSYGAGTAEPVTEYVPAEYARFYATEPQESTGEAQTWWVRGQNFIIAYSQVRPGARFARKAQPDEFAIMLCDRTSSAHVIASSGPLAVAGYSLTIVPPGDSEVVIDEGGRLIRMFTSKSSDLCEKCSNGASYDTRHPNVAELAPWPEPIGGYRTRSYSLDVPKVPGRHGTIFRCSTLMVNYVDVYDGPRDTTKLSPHSHDDFEQCSLLLEGECIHHVRFPWIQNFGAWLDDEHVRVGSPSVAIFPPPCIHTTMAIGLGRNQLVDVFSPPRVDWSEKPGWVLNADEYPMPGSVA
jgi:hypothetical protein